MIAKKRARATIENMEETLIEEEQTCNPETRSAFQKQVLMQIYLPLGLCILVLIGIVIGFSLGGIGSTGIWADISLIVLLIPGLIIGLLLLSLVVVILYGVSWVIQAIPEPAWTVQKYVKQFGNRLQLVADKTAYPFIHTSALLRSVKELWRRIWKRAGRGEEEV